MNPNLVCLKNHLSHQKIKKTFIIHKHRNYQTDNLNNNGCKNLKCKITTKQIEAEFLRRNLEIEWLKVHFHHKKTTLLKTHQANIEKIIPHLSLETILQANTNNMANNSHFNKINPKIHMTFHPSQKSKSNPLNRKIITTLTIINSAKITMCLEEVATFMILDHRTNINFDDLYLEIKIL